MPKYKLATGEVVNVSNERLEAFKKHKDFKGAILISEDVDPKKEKDPAVVDQNAELKKVTGSKLVNGSSELKSTNQEHQDILDPTMPQNVELPLKESSMSLEGESILNEDKVKQEKFLPYGDYWDKDGKLQNRTIPYEVQLDNYKKGFSDAMGATGIFEFMKDYSKEDRKRMADQLIKKPSYTTKKYNHKTDTFDVVPTVEAASKFTKNLPRDFDNFNTAKEFSTALNIGIGKTINEDPLIQFEIKKSSLEAQDELKEYSKTLNTIYDLSTPDGLKLAEADYNNRWKELVIDPVLKTDIYKNTVKQLGIVGADIADKQNIAFGRYKDTFLNVMDIGREYLPDLGFDITESLVKGGLGLVEGYNNAQVGMAQKDFEKVTGDLTRLKADVASGKIKNNQPATYGGLYSNKEGYTTNQRKGTIKDKIKYLEEQLNSKKNSIIVDLNDASKTAEYANLFKAADFSDGIQIIDLVRVFAESTPQMAIAAAGTLTGNPVLSGLGFMSMFATEYGNGYLGAIKQGLTNDDKEVSEENLLEALSTGKYASHAEAVAFAAFSAASEYAGASGVAKATMKSLGVVGDLKKVTASLYRGEAKAFVAQAAKAAKTQLTAGVGEGLTEFAQGNFAQMSIGTQLGGIKGVGDYIDTKDNMTSAVVGFALGSLIPFGGSVAKFGTTELRNASRDVATRFDLGKLGSNLKAVNGFFTEAETNLKVKFESNEITESEYQAELSHLNAVRNTGLKIPKNFSQNTKKKVFDLILKKNKIEQDIQGMEPELVLAEKKAIEEINIKLANISATERLTINVIKAKGSLDIEIIQAKNATEAKAFAESKKMNLGKDANSTGYISEDGKTVIVDMDRAAVLGEVNTASHELLHGVLFNSLYNINAEGTIEGKNVVRGLASALKTELNKIDASALKNTEFAARLQLYKDQPSSVRAEEVLTLFADALYYGDIKYNESVFTKLKDFVRQVLQNVGYKNIEFNSGKDVYNFLKDFNKGVSRGKLGKGITKVAEDGAVVGSDIRRFQGKEAVPRVKESKSQLLPEQSESIAVDIQNIQDLKKENIALAAKYDKEVIKSAKETRLENKIIESIEPVVSRLVTNRTKALYDPIADDAKRAVSRKEFQDSMKGDIEAMVLNEFTGKQDIEKFIINRGYLRANDLAKRLGIKAAEEGIAQGLEAAEKVAVEETVTEAAVKPKYKTLIQSKVLPSETVSKIKDKITKTVTLLKSKMDAKVSLNKTITPLVAEIKKEMGKQADIDIKKAMGGKAERQIEKFLLKNKKAILENMTTTWLMTAMPGAIQKQVDGKFISDWQGKKIDRETVNTNNAGKTSGAEIVRRLPNASSNISDADFLGYILDKTGNPIRGRKESLAKAIAEEVAFDIFTQQIQDPDSDISKAFEGNQERLGVVLADNFVQDLSKQIDRGNVKYSISTGIARVDTARKNVSAYLKLNYAKALYSGKLNDLKEIHKLKKSDVEFAELMDNLSSKHNEYFNLEITKANKEQAVKFEAVGNTDFNTFLNNSIMLAKTDIEGAFGLKQGSVVLNKLSDNVKEEVENALNLVLLDLIKNNGAVEGLNKFIKTYQPGLASGFKRSIYGNNNNIYKLIKKLGKSNETIKEAIKLAKLKLVKTPKGQTLHTNGKKVTTVITQETNSPDLKNLIEGSGYDVDILGRGKLSIDSEQLYISMVEILKEGLSNGSITTNAAIALLKSMGTSMRSPAKMLSKLKYFYPDKSSDSKDYTFEHGIPVQQLLVATAFYVSGGNVDISKVTNIIDKSFITLLPKRISRTVDSRFNYTFKDNNALDLDNPGFNRYFNSTIKSIHPDFNEDSMVDLINLSKMSNEAAAETVKAASNTAIARQSLSLNNNLNKQRAINNANSVKFSLSPKKIRVFDFDDTLARTKSKVLYTMPGDFSVFHGSPKDFEDIGIRSGIIYLATEKREAEAYAASNRGEVSEFILNNKDVTPEYIILNSIEQLGYSTEGASLYELIDSRFDNSLKPSQIKKVLSQLKKEGITSFSYTDGSQVSGKSTESIAVIDKSIISKKKSVDAATFAKEASAMEALGVKWDFSEFSKVIDGEKGPLLEVAKIIADKDGSKDIFVLTARPQDAAGPIQEFLASMGLNIPIENITGLGNGNPQAKADWMIPKIAEGYNDFYFADDHTGNIKAVKELLNTFDVKGKVQVAKVKFSLSMDKTFNDMIARNKGVATEKVFSDIVAKRRGALKGRWKVWMPGSLDDFKGLTSYVFAGKGRQGDADQKFFQDALITPYFRGVAAIETTRQTLKDDFKGLSKIFKPVVKKLGKKTPDGDYTYDQAIRVALWNKSGFEVPGLSKRDNTKLVNLVAKDAELSAFADGLLLISKKETWSKPSSYWDAHTILSDLNNMTEKSGRKEYIAEFIENVDIIFSKNNLNKIEAVYGTRQKDALKDIIYRMKNGTNRPAGMNKNANQWNNWVNNSIGSIMFFNRRSAILQLLSTVNFVNWSDNNPAKAALAFANQPQYWKDFATIFNSDKLRQRRAGLKSDVNEAEIANAVMNSTDKATAALSYLLKIGFTPTQIADSFAIAAGGATFYRNRINSLKKKGMTQVEAEKQAWGDFSQISEETQQSGDPALISSDQASTAGRLILSFMNTPIQLNRSIKKASLDIYNRRRIPGQTQAQSDISNISKIIYYGAIQNIIFSALQNALFALIPGFDDDDESDEVIAADLDNKTARILHSMIDTTLKGGFGYPGAVISTVKNAIREYHKQEEKGYIANHAYTILQLTSLSPPIGSKLTKVFKAIQTNKFETDVIKDRNFDVMLDGKFNLSPSYSVLGSLVEGGINLPVSRVVDELNSLTEALDSRNTAWQQIALGLGWRTWDVSAENEEHDLIKTEAKAKKKIDNKIKAAEKRKQKKNSSKDEPYKKQTYKKQTYN